MKILKIYYNKYNRLKYVIINIIVGDTNRYLNSISLILHENH